ncbi:MAG: S41 family peptidase, partial [Amphiplicatus sp.]|nr:S41 family peptidase [Amphiplicatus sp.]
VFPSEDNTIAAAKKLMEDYAGATAIIFDLREHHGGRLDEQDVFFSYLFGEPTHLVTMRIRQGKGEFMAEAFDAMPTMKRQPAENGVDIWEHWAAPVKGGSPWSKAKVYLLTSKVTASAAEHFTLALKTTGRATLIGERTRGAGNFGGGERIGERFYAFIAVGQTVDPKTGKGWDVVGIEPDIAVPADEALDRALAEIGK